MREFKFRAWDERRKVLVTSDELLSLDYTSGNWACIDEKGYGVALIKGQYKLMQYTGLHDRLGKEIYENDIVTFQDKDGYFPVSWGYFTDCCVEGETWILGEFWQPTLYYHHEQVEVVGNVYEHHHLLPKTEG